jgi:DNA-binding transcriptional LysR family regulator
VRDQILRACADAGFSPRIALETGEMSAARAFVSAGLGVTILPRSSLLSPGPDVHLVRLRPASLALAVRLDPRTAHGAESAVRERHAVLSADRGVGPDGRGLRRDRPACPSLARIAASHHGSVRAS